MIKKYSISIPLSGEALSLAEECQDRLKKEMSIDYVRDYNSGPHINIMSGTTACIDGIVSVIKKINSNENKVIELLGLGVLLTPEPLIYMRFSQSRFVRIIRAYLFDETSSLWDVLSKTVSDDVWIPKCTLAYNDVPVNRLSSAIDCLNDFDFNCSMKLSELSIIDFSEQEKEVIRVSI